MKQFLLTLFGLSETQWLWKKRQWQEYGIFSWKKHLEEARAPATSALIASFWIIYIAMTIVNGGSPFASFTGSIYDLFGFAFRDSLDLHREYWRLLTAGFVHFSLWHILFNSVAIFQVGEYAERQYGRARLFIIFCVTAIVGNLLEWPSLGQQAALGGASGGAFGLIGAAFMRAHIVRNLAMRRAMLQWALYSFAFGFFIGAANWAHLGGFLSGALLAWLIPPFGLGRPAERRFFNYLGIFFVALSLFAWASAGNRAAGIAAWKRCYRLLSEARFEEALSPCETSKNKLPTYEDPQINWEILERALGRPIKLRNSSED